MPASPAVTKRSGTQSSRLSRLKRPIGMKGDVMSKKAVKHEVGLANLLH